MILRRLAASIRKQDWFTVLLEFVIVVAGIFVGLQVTVWHEQRQLRERELSYLVRLGEDLAAMKASLAEITERGEGRREATLRAFRALEACDAALAESGDFRRSFAEYQNQQSAPIVERTYQEMVSSGALAAMADRELSADIASLFSALERYRTFIDGIRISLPEVDRVLWQNVDLSYDEAGRSTLADFDFDAACGNRELRNAVWEIHDLVWDWESATTNTATRIDALAAQLDEHLAERVGKERS